MTTAGPLGEVEELLDPEPGVLVPDEGMAVPAGARVPELEELEDGLLGQRVPPVTGTTGVPEPALVLIGVEVPAPLLEPAGVDVPELVPGTSGVVVPEIAFVLAGVVVPEPVLGTSGVDVPEPVLGTPAVAVAWPDCGVEAQAESTKANARSAENNTLFFIFPPFLNFLFGHARARGNLRNYFKRATLYCT